MNPTLKPSTATVNAALWGGHANDWAEIQEGTCRPVYVECLKRINLRVGEVYLDVGCGSGMAAQIAAKLRAKVFGLDASENLLKIALERVPEGDFRTGDLESLPFDNESFDVVTGFNSFQYAGNPAVALGEAKRVAKPGGRIVVMTWGNPEGMQAATLVAALKALLPSPPPGAPGPFALSDEVALTAFAVEAGLEPIEIFDVPSPWYYPNLSVALRGLMSSGVAARAVANTSLEKVNAAHQRALEPFEHQDGTYTVQAVYRCLVARSNF